MKKNIIILVLFCLSIPGLSWAGRESGGGDKTKLDIYETYTKLKKLSNTDVLLKYPWLLDSFKLLTGDKALNIQISDTPIKNCAYSSTPIACARITQNVIEFYSNPDMGWESTSEKIKFKILLHELLWWSEIKNDNNFQVSAPVIDDIIVMNERKDNVVTCVVDFQGINGEYLPIRLTGQKDKYGRSAIRQTTEFKSYSYTLDVIYDGTSYYDDHMSINFYPTTTLTVDGRIITTSTNTRGQTANIQTSAYTHMGLNNVSIFCSSLTK